LSKKNLDDLHIFILSKGASTDKEILRKEEMLMPVHHGGRVGKAAKTLAKKSSSKSAKSNAGKTLANHKAKEHSK